MENYFLYFWIGMCALLLLWAFIAFGFDVQDYKDKSKKIEEDFKAEVQSIRNQHLKR